MGLWCPVCLHLFLTCQCLSPRGRECWSLPVFFIRRLAYFLFLHLVLYLSDPEYIHFPVSLIKILHLVMQNCCCDALFSFSALPHLFTLILRLCCCFTASYFWFIVKIICFLPQFPFLRMFNFQCCIKNLKRALTVFTL